MNGKTGPVGPAQTPAGKSTSESNRATGRAAGATPNLVTMRADYARAFVAGYSEGFALGYARALDDLEAADDRAWAELSRTVRRQASSPRYSQLCDRRGDHDRAEAARELERRNGLDLAS